VQYTLEERTKRFELSKTFKKQRALFCVPKINEIFKSYPHFGQKKRALPQLSEKSLIETRPCFCLSSVSRLACICITSKS